MLSRRYMGGLCEYTLDFVSFDGKAELSFCGMPGPMACLPGARRVPGAGHTQATHAGYVQAAYRPYALPCAGSVLLFCLLVLAFSRRFHLASAMSDAVAQYR